MAVPELYTLGVDEDVIGTTLPHSEFGEPDCCGCLNVIIRGEIADFICNECEAVVRAVAASDVQKTLAEMELSLDVATALCPYCRVVNLFPGFTEMLAYRCQSCRRAVAEEDCRSSES
jgi:hypothetical protein